MLIFISDLHFVDETAGKHNISARAFEGIFEDIKRYCGRPSEIKIIFLGDIFDLNRTTYWLEVGESERPWGDIEEKRDIVESHAGKIVDEIIAKNKGTFDILSGSFKDRFSYAVEPDRIYIPGNHDRLCNIFPSLREKVRKNLGIPRDPKAFPNCYDDKKYGVIAWHGHERDVMNHEGSTGFGDADYARTPIGDLITTEIASRLPYTIMKHLDSMSPALTSGEKENLRRNLEEIENVRPYSVLFDWLFYQVGEQPGLKEEIKTALDEIVDNFNSLKYLERWYERHDRWNPLASDEADKLQQTMRLFKFFDIETAEGLMKIYTNIFGSPDSLPMDDCEKGLVDRAKEFFIESPDYRYCLMGHNHNPAQVPIRITDGGVEQVYLNTGTWRKRYIKGQNGGFVALKNLTYTVIYSEGENKNQQFETWTGSLKEG